MKQKKARTAGRVPAKEIAVFCEQVALLLQAGIPLNDGLDTLTDEGTASGRELLQFLAEQVRETGSLYTAVREAGVFPHYMVQMIRVGENAGKLETVMQALSLYYAREDKLRTAVRSAVFYPVILIVLMAAVIVVMAVAVLPVFSQVLSELGSEAGSNGFLTVGAAVGRCALGVVAVLMVILLAVLVASLTSGGRAWLIRISRRLPGLRRVHRRMASGRFASALSMMLSSGYDLQEALKLSGDVVTDPTVKQKITQCRELVENGTPFADALLQLDLFSGLYARLIQTGEKTGRLDEVMQKMAAQYEEESYETLSSLVAVIEPTLVILMSIIIGGILLSVMLPLIGMISLIG